jgi:hypothetical protein
MNSEPHVLCPRVCALEQYNKSLASLARYGENILAYAANSLLDISSDMAYESRDDIEEKHRKHFTLSVFDHKTVKL